MGRLQNKGFTLIELAIALIIFGLLAGAYFSTASIYIKQKKLDNLNERINTVRAALAYYTKDDPNTADDPVRFPCPASLTTPSGAVGYGEEICPANYSSVAAGDDLGGVFVVNGATPGSLVLVGAVPAKTLDMSEDFILDEYGNRLIYAITMDLTEDDALLTQPAPSAAITREYKEKQPDGSIAELVSIVDFIIASHGEDGAGSYTRTGSLNGNRCRATTTPGLGDSRNCLWQTSLEAIFRDEEYNFAQADTDFHFDDVVVHALGDNTKGWWQSSNGAGSDIVSKNPANMGIGPGITSPLQRVDVDGAIKIANTASACNSSTIGSIRYNNGIEDVVECCNGNPSDGYAWSNIAYGCATGKCTQATKGQMRYNAALRSPEYCNGLTFVPVFGRNCSSNTYYNGEILEEPEVETQPCDGGASGNMTRTRTSARVCNNGTLETYPASEWDRSGCT